MTCETQIREQLARAEEEISGLRHQLALEREISEKFKSAALHERERREKAEAALLDLEIASIAMNASTESSESENFRKAIGRAYAVRAGLEPEDGAS